MGDVRKPDSGEAREGESYETREHAERTCTHHVGSGR
jgi:hypothetical protein